MRSWAILFFFDLDSLHDGRFDGRIADAISSSVVFMLVLSPNALDRCSNESDWLRKEIEYAISTNCHIVPVNPDQKFVKFPPTLPDTIRKQLSYIQISDLMLGQLFQASLEKVVKERILPFIPQFSEPVTNLHVNATEECEVLSYNERLGKVHVDEYAVFKLKTGRYILTFISSSGEKKEIQYEATNKSDDFIVIDFSKTAKKWKLWLVIGGIVAVIIGLAIYLWQRDNNFPNFMFAEDKTLFCINGVPFELVYVEGGTYRMGALDTLEADPDEFPVHIVRVPNFMIGKYPVTQKQWMSIMDCNPSYYKGDELPVEGVSWFDAQEFTRKLSLLTGKEFDLPTEAEWEYAARGGNKSKGYRYSGGNDPNEVGWFKDNSESGTHIVGEKSPNELGIYDMSGNVWEWCWDYYGEVYYANCFDSISSIGPQGMPKANWRVFRGGSVQLPQNCMRVSNRDSFEPSGRDHDVGFRLKLKL